MLILVLSSCGYASDIFSPQLSAEWVAVDTNDVKVKYAGWDLQLWRHDKNGSLLVIAKDPMDRSLDSGADLDRAMDFATSAHPEWIPADDFPTWRSEDFDYEPRFIKLSLSKFTTGKVTVPAVEYSMVNENDLIPMMANGLVAKLPSGTRYVQLTSTRPISDAIPRDVLRQLVEHEGLLAAETLENYIGAWLFQDDRKQVWTGVKDASNGSIVLYEQYNAACGPVQRRWVFHFDRERQKYVGKLKTTFKQELHETNISGEWDQDDSAMTWTLESDVLQNAKIRHCFQQGKLVVTELRLGDDPSRFKWRELGTLSPTAR